jgi:succinyl-CoA synthetase alpha subunit
VLTPGECKIGIMPGNIFKRGSVGVVSRSGTLTYEAVFQTSNAGLGQTTAVGHRRRSGEGHRVHRRAGDVPADDETQSIIMIGEIGGSAERTRPSSSPTKPSAAEASRWWASSQASPRLRAAAWHAGAIISGGKGGAGDKTAAMERAGIRVSRLGGPRQTLAEVLKG